MPPVLEADMHRGWFKVWRKWQDHEVASDPNGWLVLTHIFCEVRRQAKFNRVSGLTVGFGECDLTQDQLSQRTRLSRKAVRAALSRLVRYETIKMRPEKGQRQGHRRNIITVINWAVYNGAQPEQGQAPGAEGATAGNMQGNMQGAKPLEVKQLILEEGTTTPARDFDFRADFLDHYPKFSNGRLNVQGAERFWYGLKDHAAVKACVLAFADEVAKWPPEERRYLQSPLKWLETEAEHGFRIRREDWAGKSADVGRNKGLSRTFDTRAEQGDKFAGLGT